MIEISTESLFGWETHFFQWGDLRIGLSPAIGGRITSIQKGGVELLFLQEKHLGETFQFDRGFPISRTKREMGFRLWGGDKTWVAPQSDWIEAIPPLELDAAPYQFTALSNGGEMKSPVCQETGIQILRKIQLIDERTVLLEQTFTNHSDHPCHRGIWDVTQFNRPGDVILPVKKQEVRGYPSEGKSVELLDDYVFADEKDTSRIPCREPIHFKFGTVSEKGSVLALFGPFQDEKILHGRSFPVEKNGSYLHKSNIEVYNSPEYGYLELEVHAPAKKIQPGESQSHTQLWTFDRIGKEEWENSRKYFQMLFENADGSTY